MITEQMNFWRGEFGQEYTERNRRDAAEHDAFYKSEYGVARTTMNRDFLYDLPVENILEVGCNVGNQLTSLQSVKPWRLYGIELQPYAVERAKSTTQGINIIEGSAFDLPFRDNFFDLVFTSGVLIHIAPADLTKAMQEIYRTSGRYIWGFEYYADQLQEIPYRGNESKMWKGNYAEKYMEMFPDLRLVKEERYKYVNNDNVDQMFLLEKQEG
jgi:pseudaminic acid biosynthesis-associated methylase